MRSTGNEIYTKLTGILVDALMAGAPHEVKAGAKAMGVALQPDKVKGTARAPLPLSRPPPSVARHCAAWLGTASDL